MPLSLAAQQNHDRLFPNHASPLKTTDPELIEIFDNFAFDEVLRQGGLDEKTRMKVILAALIASQTLGEYRVMLGGALEIGVTPLEAREIVYQAVPYCGMAIVYDFLHATNQILESRGVKLPLESQARTTQETRAEKGLELQRAIFGESIDRMRQQAPPTQRHIQDFLSANCFGDHCTRAGFDIQTRELLTFAMLAALRGCEPQLKGHIQGNAAIGNGKARLLAVLTQLLPYLGYPRILNALHCLNDVLPETDESGASTAPLERN